MRKSLYILGQLSELDIEWLATKGDKLQVAPGTTLIKENETVDALYIRHKRLQRLVNTPVYVPPQ